MTELELKLIIIVVGVVVAFVALGAFGVRHNEHLARARKKASKGEESVTK